MLDAEQLGNPCFHAANRTATPFQVKGVSTLALGLLDPSRSGSFPRTEGVAMKPRRVSISRRSRGRPHAPTTGWPLVFDSTDGDSGHNRRVTLPRWRKHPFAILGG